MARSVPERWGAAISARRRRGGTVIRGTWRFQEDPHWLDQLQFFEYFHGDNGAGMGANHQTGWTGIVARAMHLFATTTPEMVERGLDRAPGR